MSSTAQAQVSPFYGARTHMLSGIAKALTDGKVSKVQVSGAVSTGMAEFDVRTGKVRRIVLPKEENLPEGFTLDAARGLMDHEDAHALFTTVDPGTGRAGALRHTIANILEDPRVEALKGARYPGAAENIGALQAIGLRVIRESLAAPQVETLDAALRGLSLVAYRADLAPVRARADGRQIMAFLTAAEPHVAFALASETTAGVMEAAERIEALLKTPLAPAPSVAGGGQGEGEGEADSCGSGTMAQEAPSKPEARDDSPNAPEQAQERSSGQEGTAVAEDAGAEEPEAGEAPELENEVEADGPAEADLTATPEGESAEDAPDAGATEAPSDQALGDMGEGGDPGSDEPDSAPFDPIWNPEAEQDMPKEGFTPAEVVAMLLEPALDEAEAESKRVEAMELLEATRGGILAPNGLTVQAFYEGMTIIDCPKDRGAFATMRDQVRNVSMGIRNALRQHLLAEGRTRFLADREAGSLDPKALYKVAAGLPVRPFREMQHGRSTKTAITLLADQSGSMGCEDKMRQAQLAATALCEALAGLPGVTVEVLGFSVAWSGQLLHRVAKPFRSRDASGIATLTSGGGNADGAALRWAAVRLLAQQADRRILMVLSDGDPTDTANGGHDGAVMDLRAAVDACERHGIETVAIGILSKSVSRFYPKHVSIWNAMELQGEVLRMMADLIKPKAVAHGRAKARGVV